MSNVHVKPLEWHAVEEGWWAASPAHLPLPYEVRLTGRGAVRVRTYGTDWAYFDGTAEVAKAACQADFERRVLASLVAPSATG